MDHVKSMARLVSDAEGLLAKLGDSASPEIRQLLAKVESSVAEMKDVIAHEGKASAEKLQEVTESVVDYVRQNPWVAIAAGTAVAVALIYVALATRADSGDT